MRHSVSLFCRLRDRMYFFVLQHRHCANYCCCKMHNSVCLMFASACCTNMSVLLLLQIACVHDNSLDTIRCCLHESSLCMHLMSVSVVACVQVFVCSCLVSGCYAPSRIFWFGGFAPTQKKIANNVNMFSIRYSGIHTNNFPTPRRKCFICQSYCRNLLIRFDMFHHNTFSRCRTASSPNTYAAQC